MSHDLDHPKIFPLELRVLKKCWGDSPLSDRKIVVPRSDTQNNETQISHSQA